MTDRNEIMELAVVMKAKHCPHIVGFFGCLLRDVSMCVCVCMPTFLFSISCVYEYVRSHTVYNICVGVVCSMISVFLLWF